MRIGYLCYKENGETIFLSHPPYSELVYLDVVKIAYQPIIDTPLPKPKPLPEIIR